jgi:hypothetical protein
LASKRRSSIDKKQFEKMGCFVANNLSQYSYGRGLREGLNYDFLVALRPSLPQSMLSVKFIEVARFAFGSNTNLQELSSTSCVQFPFEHDDATSIKKPGIARGCREFVANTGP